MKVKVYHIEQFKCHFCSEWFNASSRLPLKLRCSHNVCRSCVQNNHQGGAGSQLRIVCPEDLEVSNYRSLSDIEVDTVTKHILERLLGKDDVHKCNNHLELIKDYSKAFDELTCQATAQIDRLNSLIDEIYKDEIARIESIWTRTKLEINRPMKLISDWKEVVKHYLRQLKKSTCEGNSVCDLSQFEHYIDEAKKAHLEIVGFLDWNKEQLVEQILCNKGQCFQNGFSLFTHQPQMSGVDSSCQHTKKSKRSSAMLATGSQSHNNKENILKGHLPLRNENLEDIRRRVANQQHQGESPKEMSIFQNGMAHLSSIKPKSGHRQLEDNKSCSIFELSRSGNASDVSMSTGDLTPIAGGTIRGKRQEVKPAGLTEKCVKSNRYVTDQKGETHMPSKPKVRSHRREEEENSEEMLKEIEELNEEMLLSTYEVDEEEPFEATQKLKLRTQQTTTGAELGDGKFSYQEPTEELRERISKALLKPSGLINFYRPAVNNASSQGAESPEVRRGYVYDCETEKHNYTMKMRIMKVQEAMLATTVGSNFIELVNHPLQTVDFRCYLELQNWSLRLEILKFVKCNLQDQQFNVLLNFVLRNATVHTLVVSNNQLGDESVDMLLEFYAANKQLRNVYLSKNHISLLRCKQKIAQLKNHLNIYI